jgi:peptidoglycan/LPS O-acetylase OafA/YrhL
MGLVRLFLALVVAIGHLQGIVLDPAHLGFSGYYTFGMNAGFAVIFFYVISGFLISLGLSRKYEPTSSGTLEFYKSRFIRIFSLYWPVVVIILIASPDIRASFLAGSIPDKFTNLFIIGMDWRIPFASYPDSHWAAALFGLRQAWTLGAELTFYVLAPVLLRSWRLALVAFALSAATRITAVSAVGFNSAWSYQFLPSTFLFFLIGHFAQAASSRWSLLNKPSLGCAFLAVSLLSLAAGPGASWDGARFWIAVSCFAAAIPGIFHGTKRSAALNVLGELSYPVYLTHLFVIVVLTKNDTGFLPDLANTLGSGPEVTAIFLVIAIGAAVAAHWLLEKPMAAILRSLVRYCSAPLAKVRPDAVDGLPASSCALGLRYTSVPTE